MEDNRKNNGGWSTKSNSPTDKRKLTRSELLDAYISLKPMLPDALSVLDSAIRDKEQWAVTLFFRYFFSLPKTTIEQHTNFDTNDFNIRDIFRASGSPINIPTTNEEYKQLNK